MGAVLGGDKLKKELENLTNLKSTELETGFLGGQTYPNGEKVSEVAMKNEYGGIGYLPDGPIHIPPRPFFRATIEQNKDNWSRNILQDLEKNGDFEKTLTKLGKEIKQKLQENIKKWDSPPNSPRTIAYKGFNDPLIHTRLMLNSVNYQVGESGEIETDSE